MQLPKTFLASDSLAFEIWNVKSSSIHVGYSLKRATLMAGKVLESRFEHRFQRTVIFSGYILKIEDSTVNLLLLLEVC